MAIAINCDYWLSLDFDAEEIAKKIVPLAFAMADIPVSLHGRDLEFSIVLTDDETTQALNRDYRGKDKPTNVLSFAMLDSNDDDFLPPADQPLPVGDIILAYETIESEAIEQSKPLRDHYAHLLVHGALHLLGYDHEAPHEGDVMESLEIRILKKYGIENPYLDGKTVA